MRNIIRAAITAAVLSLGLAAPVAAGPFEDGLNAGSGETLESHITTLKTKPADTTSLQASDRYYPSQPAAAQRGAPATGPFPMAKTKPAETMSLQAGDRYYPSQPAAAQRGAPADIAFYLARGDTDA